MTEPNPAPQQPSAPATGFVLPTHSSEGRALTAREQFATMSRNEKWAADAVQEGTQARQQFDDLNRRMAEDLDAQGAPDRHFAEANRPAASPTDYVLQGLDPLESQDVADFDTAARSWLQEAGFSRDAGSRLAARMDDFARQSARWGESELERHRQASVATLQKIYGGDLAAKLDAVDDLIDAVEAKHPGVQDMLDANPAILYDSQVLHELIQVAERRSAVT